MADLVPSRSSSLVPLPPSLLPTNPNALDVPLLDQVVRQADLTTAALNLATAAMSDDGILDDFEQLSWELEEITAETEDLLENL